MPKFTILDSPKIRHPGTACKERKIERLGGRPLLLVRRRETKVVYKDEIAMSCKLFGFHAVPRGDFKLLWLPHPFGTGD